MEQKNGPVRTRRILRETRYRRLLFALIGYAPRCFRRHGKIALYLRVPSTAQITAPIAVAFI